jgi:hypothetical protein
MALADLILSSRPGCDLRSVALMLREALLVA